MGKLKFFFIKSKGEKRKFIHIRSDIRLQHIFWKAVLTFVLWRKCSVTLIFQQHRFILTLTEIILNKFTEIFIREDDFIIINLMKLKIELKAE